MLLAASSEFAMSWIDLAKGGVGGVFLALFTWLVVFQMPKMHHDLMESETKFTESLRSLMASYKTEQEALRDAFRREQDSTRKANILQHEASIVAFESALREICNRAERSDERMNQLLREVMPHHDGGNVETKAVVR